MSITYGLQWSESPRRIGYHGDVLTAEPTKTFWDAWKAHKETIKAEGIKVIKTDAGYLVLCKPEDKPGPHTVLPPAPAPASRVVSQAPATSTGSDAVTVAINWSDEQKAIFTEYKTGKRNFIVRARAGTGKTKTTEVALSLLCEVSPGLRCLYAVFNKRNQIEAAAKIKNPEVDVLTLHSVGLRNIKRIWPKALVQRDNANAIEYDRIERAAGGQVPEEVNGELFKLVGFLKNCTINPTIEDAVEIAEQRLIECPNYELPEVGGFTVGKLAELALKVLELSKTQEPDHRISFNDMVWLPVALNIVRAEYDFVVVDEAQDMNAPQLEMARKSCKPGGRVCVIGDDRQAIYEFRGAHQDGLNMMKTVLDAGEFPLTITYRCPKAVVNIAKQYVPDYQSAPTAPEGVVDSIGASVLQNRVQIGDAILSRLNAPMMSLCLSLLKAGTPARIEGRDIGRTLLGIIKKFKAKSIPDYLRKVVAWGEKMKARSAARFSETAQALIQDQVNMLIAVAEDLKSVKEIEDRITALFTDTDGKERPAVVLSTVHKAKGLEWDRVFILNETFRWKGGQEDNVYYVAVTRAKKHLTFVGERPEGKENL